MQRLIIIGAGKYGREVANLAWQCHEHGKVWELVGYLDDRVSRNEKAHYDLPVVGSVEEYNPGPDDVFVCALGSPKFKKHYCEIMLNKGGRFADLIHPTAIIGRNVDMGKGIILGPFSMLACDLRVGNFVTITGFGGSAHESSIGDWCQISGHCGINGNAVLEEGVFLGSHACILPHARVGAWAYVGAGSVVLRRVPTRTKVFGNPAVVIGTVDDAPASA